MSASNDPLDPRNSMLYDDIRHRRATVNQQMVNNSATASPISVADDATSRDDNYNRPPAHGIDEPREGT